MALNLQWKRNGVPITGATASTYTRGPLALGDGGAFTVDVTNTVSGRTVTLGPLDVLVRALVPEAVLEYGEPVIEDGVQVIEMR